LSKVLTWVDLQEIILSVPAIRDKDRACTVMPCLYSLRPGRARVPLVPEPDFSMPVEER